MNKLDSIIILLAVIICWSCANPVGLVGGAEDTQAPGIVPDGILPKNEQTNFKKSPIYFTFDEWVKLEDVLNQVVVSPPLEYTPELKLKGKTVSFEFDEKEDLREETTYTINFGEAVKDLTENNPAENLKYVFSTGDEIDSLSVNGRVLDAIEKTPVEDVLVMLYENLSDTVFRTERPYYFSRTDKNGSFQIQNIKEGTFQALALKDDQGQKYLYDNPQESIGYLNENLIISDTANNNFDIEIFQERQPLLIKNKSIDHFGLLVYEFNREPFDLDLNLSDQSIESISQVVDDTLKLWYTSQDSFAVYTSFDTLWYDTLEVQKLNKASFLNLSSLNLKGRKPGVKKIAPKEKIELNFNHPIRILNRDSIALLKDSLRTTSDFDVEINADDLTSIQLTSDWSELSSYALEFYPGALEDIYGLKNDTIIVNLLATEKKSFGEILLKIEELDVNSAYLVEMINGTNKLVDEFQINGIASFEKNYPYLMPGEYSIKVVEDRNNNGRWDEGDFDAKLYPEKIFNQKLEALRANWTVEANIKPVF